jgi:hypothetical protein
LDSRSVSNFDDWTGRHGRLSDKWGHTDYDRHEIVIDPRCRAAGLEREIVIHEMLHKLFPWMDEGPVAVAAKEIDDALDEFDL